MERELSVVDCWVETSLKRVYPKTPAGNRKTLRLLSARNDRLSFQICVRNSSMDTEVKVEVVAESPDDLRMTVRRVGYVPMLHLNTGTPPEETEGLEHLPGLVPEPLFPETSTVLGPAETQSFWVSVNVPAGVAPGIRKLRFTMKIGDKEKRSLSAAIDVRPLVIQLRRDFLVGHWFYADSLCDWYKVEPYERDFWRIVEPYMADYMGHENNTMFVPHLTPPINGEHRAQQLLRVKIPKPGRYEFDFADVRRWIRMAISHGAESFFFSHLFTQWGAKHAARVYLSNQDPSSLLWPKETPATAKIYRDFLVQYLPKLREFMKREGILDRSYVQMSDEPVGEESLVNYRKGKAMVREIAPWIKAIDGLSEVCYYKEGLCEMPISGLGAAEKFRAENLPHCVYYCCGPRGTWLNRLFDTPLAKIRMTGWLCYRLGASGIMHWGYNYWYRDCTDQPIDPFVEHAMCEWPFIPYGDPFVVYPGKDGPLDSIRWEVFADSIRDYALLQTAGVSADDPMLNRIESYEHFPKSESWILSARRKLLGAGE